jgi:hypothetical protein
MSERTFRIRTTISDRLGCKGPLEIGQAVLELVDHHNSSPGFSGLEEAVFKVEEEGEPQEHSPMEKVIMIEGLTRRLADEGAALSVRAALQPWLDEQA